VAARQATALVGAQTSSTAAAAASDAAEVGRCSLTR